MRVDGGVVKTIVSEAKATERDCLRRCAGIRIDMSVVRRLRSIVAIMVLALCAVAANVAYARAQAALPTAPGASKVVEGGAPQAPASVPGAGASPLEPYLITWLLPVAGIVCAVVGVGIDRRMRATGGR